MSVAFLTFPFACCLSGSCALGAQWWASDGVDGALPAAHWPLHLRLLLVRSLHGELPASQRTTSTTAPNLRFALALIAVFFLLCFLPATQTSTWDIIAEKYGLMLLWGDYVFIPFTFTMQNWYLVNLKASKRAIARFAASTCCSRLLCQQFVARSCRASSSCIPTLSNPCPPSHSVFHDCRWFSNHSSPLSRLISLSFIRLVCCLPTLSQDSAVHPAFKVAAVLFFIAGYLIFRITNKQKHEFKHDKTHTKPVWGTGFQLLFDRTRVADKCDSLQANHRLSSAESELVFSITDQPCFVIARRYLRFIGAFAFVQAKRGFLSSRCSISLAGAHLVLVCCRRLLCSGLWAYSRHMNYFGDLLLAASYSLPCGAPHECVLPCAFNACCNARLHFRVPLCLSVVNRAFLIHVLNFLSYLAIHLPSLTSFRCCRCSFLSLLAWFYPIYLTILLIHRERRDEAR